MADPTSVEYAHALDARDPLAEYRDRYAPTGDTIYLTGATIAEQADLDTIAEQAAVADKARSLTGYAIALVDALLTPDYGIQVASPRDPHQRDAHVSLRHPQARQIAAALAAIDVIVGTRPPDLIRIGLAPLSTSHTDVHHGIAAIRDVLASRAHHHH